MSDEQLRMTAYYYGFYDTGVREIDLILSAVACAGKAFHHTQDWNDDCTWIGHEGDTPEAWIQNAGRKAADEIERLRAELAAERERMTIEECAAYLESINHKNTATLLRRAMNKGGGNE